MENKVIGPILFLDHCTVSRATVSALVIVPKGEKPEPLSVSSRSFCFEVLSHFEAYDIFRARFEVPYGAASYAWCGKTYGLNLCRDGDLRLGYASCNGCEHGDLARERSERDVMWAKLAQEHRASPFSLLLHGGDQVYADEATLAHPLTEDWPDKIPEEVSEEALSDLRSALREAFFERYVHFYSGPDVAYLVARVPSLMQWDDHDICDGWGSLRSKTLHSEVGQTLYDVARECFLLFQQGCLLDDLPARFEDENAGHLGWSVQFGNTRIIAPDLRGERGRRQVMGAGGWRMIEALFEEEFKGHTFLMSSVPLLGPRLSILEGVMMLIPKMQEYEDDLRDQWQSRAHRQEWSRMLRLVAHAMERGEETVTILSGEIHLASRGEMKLNGSRVLHQLIASGVTHPPPPKLWARALGWIAMLGEDPLRGHPVTMKPLPGQRKTYLAQRNVLTLEKVSEIWQAQWHLEEAGSTPPLRL